MHKEANRIKTFLQMSQPHFLLSTLFTYVLGVVIASYLVINIDQALFLWGLLFVLSLRQMVSFLETYFDHAPNTSSILLEAADPDEDKPAEVLQVRSFLIAAMFCLPFTGSSLAALLLADVSILSLLIAAILVVFSILHASPPAELKYSGFGELIIASLTAGLVPAFSFSLMAANLHRLLPMTTSALAAFYFAAQIIGQMQTYAGDVRKEKKRLMTLLGWKRALQIHDFALEFGFFTLILAFLFGLPVRVSYSMLIVLPLIIAQIWQLARIRSGSRPNFRLLGYTAYGIFYLTLYLEILGLLLT